MSLRLADGVDTARQLLARVATLAALAGQLAVTVIVGRAARGGACAAAYEGIALRSGRADALEVALLVDAAGAGSTGAVAALVLVAAALVRVTRVSSVTEAPGRIGRSAPGVHAAWEPLTRTCERQNARQRGLSAPA